MSEAVRGGRGGGGCRTRHGDGDVLRRPWPGRVRHVDLRPAAAHRRRRRARAGSGAYLTDGGEVCRPAARGNLPTSPAPACCRGASRRTPRLWEIVLPGENTPGEPLVRLVHDSAGDGRPARCGVRPIQLGGLRSAGQGDDPGPTSAVRARAGRASSLPGGEGRRSARPTRSSAREPEGRAENQSRAGTVTAP